MQIGNLSVLDSNRLTHYQVRLDAIRIRKIGGRLAAYEMLPTIHIDELENLLELSVEALTERAIKEPTE